MDNTSDNGPDLEKIYKSMALIPTCEFIVTAKHEDRTTGMMTRLVQKVCDSPLMISMSIPKGKAIMPLISESAKFGLCLLKEDSTILKRKFSSDLDPADDPFVSFAMVDNGHHIPILADSAAYFQCQVARHLDVDGDHDLFIGRILHADVL